MLGEILPARKLSSFQILKTGAGKRPNRICWVRFCTPKWPNPENGKWGLAWAQLSDLPSSEFDQTCKLPVSEMLGEIWLARKLGNLQVLEPPQIFGI